MSLPGLLADAVVLVHAAFVLFVVFGGFLALRWRRLAWVHLPTLAWGVWIEVAGWICPLTPLEVELRRQAGEQGYRGGFVEHYVLPTLYPEGLTRPLQWLLATLLLVVNAVAYTLWWRQRPEATRRDAKGPS